MIVYLLLLITVCVASLKYSKVSSLKPFTIEQTSALKGLAIFFVFFNHLFGYLPNDISHLALPGDGLFEFIINQSTQLMVGLFLFMSGYGVYCQIQKKGSSYINNIPIKRILSTLLNFDIAVLLFAITLFVLGIPISTKKFFLSLTAWDSIGNSNWYIFAILYCYMSTYLSFRFTKRASRAMLLQAAFIIVYLLIMPILKTGLFWWYMTICCYPAGMFYSKFNERIDKFLSVKYFFWLGTLLVTICVLLLFFGNFYIYNIVAISFCFICVSLSIRFRINSRMLSWCGKNLFPIYVYQRLPMIVFSAILPKIASILEIHMFIILCMISTILIARYMPVLKIKGKYK